MDRKKRGPTGTQAAHLGKMLVAVRLWDHNYNYLVKIAKRDLRNLSSEIEWLIEEARRAEEKGDQEKGGS